MAFGKDSASAPGGRGSVYQPPRAEPGSAALSGPASGTRARLRIVHINNTANVAWRIAQAQKALGHEAVVCSLFDTPFHFPYDVRFEGAMGPIGFNRVMFRERKFFAGFDVLHVHNGIWPAQVFYPWFKARHPGKVIAVHYHGSETRTGKGLHHRYCIDVKFHSTPDLAPYLRGSHLVLNPIDLPDLPPEPGNAKPRFGHFVSNPQHKGTQAVLRLFEDVFGPVDTAQEGGITRLVGKAAELDVVAGLDHEAALRVMRTCDAVIDQISGFGIYGMVAIEAMAYAKPVLSTYNPAWYPDCPIVLIREGVAAALKRVAADERYRRDLGRQGREYVARVHDSRTIARKVLDAYRLQGDPRSCDIPR